MASLGNALVNRILGHSAAEKAFRPWWDTLEDYLVYGLVMLGLLTVPTSIITSGTPLDCNFCKGDICKGLGAEFNITPPPGKTEDPGFNAWWIKKYCTQTAVDEFILYFPFILLLMALLLVLIENSFIKIFRAGLKLDMVYGLLVKDQLLDVQKEKVDNVDQTDGPAAAVADELGNTKAALEVSHSFSEVSNFFFSYMVRNVCELVVAGGLFAILLWRGLPILQKEKFIFCDVHGYQYECAGHPQEFYIIVLLVALACLLAYLICSIYNLMWLVIPNMSPLSRVMKRYKKHVLQRATKEVTHSFTEEELLGELYHVYYNNRDLSLLLNLLTSSSGIAPSIRILSLFDADFRAKSEVRNLAVTRSESGEAATVNFEDALSVADFFSDVKEVAFIYTVEILPPTPKSSVTVFKPGIGHGHSIKTNEAGDTEMQLLDDLKLKSTEFIGLDPTKEYSIVISTVGNGRTIARRREIIKPKME